MKANDMLNKIKNIIGVELSETEIELAMMKLQNGTMIEAEEFKKGEAIFIKSDDEKIAMPVGEYMLEDGRMLVVEEEGIIADMRDVSDDVPAKEEASEESKEEMTEESIDESNVELEEEEVAFDMAEMEKRIQNLEDAIADLKADKVEAPKEMSEDIKEEIIEEVKSELSEEEIKENVNEVELSAEVAEPVKHNPEATNESKFTLNKTNYPKTLQQRIYEKLNN